MTVSASSPRYSLCKKGVRSHNLRHFRPSGPQLAQFPEPVSDKMRLAIPAGISKECHERYFRLPSRGQKVEQGRIGKLTSQYLTHIMGLCKFGVVKEEPSI